MDAITSMFTPISSDQEAQIKQTLADTLKDFLTTYPVQFGIAIANSVKDESNPDSDPLDDLELKQAPPASEPLKKGFISKKGAIVKNWKRRYAVAYNAADNFKIEYFDSEGGKLKGTISPACYYVTEFSQEEEALHGLYGLKLVPWWYWRTRRTWYIRCEDNEDRKQWKEALSKCAWKATASRNPNPVIADAFDATLDFLRTKYGYWGRCGPYGTETERLSDFFNEVLGERVVWSILDGISPGMFHNRASDAVMGIVSALVAAAVKSAWESVVQISNTAQDKLMPIARANLGPLFEKQVELKAKIVGFVSSKVDPFLEEYGSKIFKPLLQVIIAPLKRAFIEAFRGIKSHVKSLPAFSTVEVRKANLQILYSDADWGSWGHMSEPSKILWDMYYEANGTLGAVFQLVGGYGPYEFMQQIRDAVCDLSKRFVYTLNEYCDTSPTVDYITHYSHAFNNYIHDVTLLLKILVTQVIKRVLSDPLDKYLIQPSLELVQPVQEMLEAIPIPGFAELFSVTDMLQEVCDEIADKAIEAATVSIDKIADETSEELRSELNA